MLARPPFVRPAMPARAARAGLLEGAVRSTPIRWRILAIAVLNSAVALVLLALIWDGANVLGNAWADLRRVRQSERFLASIDSDAERLQSLIHRYFAQTDPKVLERSLDLRETLLSRLRVQARLDPLIAEPVSNLTEMTERFMQGFDALRDTRAAISLTYETKILRPSREMAGLYAILGNALQETSLITPILAKSRESYNAMILTTNAFYLSASPTSAREAKSHVEVIRRTAPVMLDLSGEDIQRRALEGLQRRTQALENGIDELSAQFAAQSKLLREEIDGNAAAMSGAVERMNSGVRSLERSAQARFDQTLNDVAAKLGIVALAFVGLVVLMGIGIARSISEPLGDLRTSMNAIMQGEYDRPIGGLMARDEIGEMARAVDVFRENAIAKSRAEEELRSAKDSAETALRDIRSMQTTLIESEKLAALGGLVAGVAHEVNNPVGISLTVASSLARRGEAFKAEIASGQIRRSRLEDFTAGVQDAAGQLVANLHRAGELVQSFKQVAVDRSQAERRSFDLGQATEQILASLRPGIKASPIQLVVDVPAGITMDGFPGPFGQVLTNLFLNAVHHAFAEGQEGHIAISAHRISADQVEIAFRDDGRGMSEDVQRQAFEPFFTTRRGAGGTGLGLHIVYNLVTRRLGGRIALVSAPGAGSTFLITLPLVAPREAAPARETRQAPPTRAAVEDKHAGS